MVDCFLAPEEGLEPPTNPLTADRSTKLSYSGKIEGVGAEALGAETPTLQKEFRT